MANPETLILRSVNGRCGSVRHVLDMLDEDLQVYSEFTLHNQELLDVLAAQASAVREELNRLHNEVKRALMLGFELRP